MVLCIVNCYVFYAWAIVIKSFHSPFKQTSANKLTGKWTWMKLIVQLHYRKRVNYYLDENAMHKIILASDIIPLHVLRQQKRK